MSIPPTARDKLLHDPRHGVPYVRLRQTHQAVVEPTWRKGGSPAMCTNCKTLWPCEVGQALGIIDALLLQLVTR